MLVEPEFRLSKEDFMWELYTNKRIKVWSHYMPIHLTTAYRNLGMPKANARWPRRCSTSMSACRFIRGMTEEAIAYLIDSIRALA